MRKTIFSTGLTALALAAFIAATPALAETVNFKVDLKAANEVPPVVGKGLGTAVVTYDTASKKLTWKITYAGLTGNATAAHFHGPAAADKNAPVVLPFVGNLASPIEGSATITDAQAADILAGNWYINVHTAENKPGEIRGQVKK
jgi:hypothetical protein